MSKQIIGNPQLPITEQLTSSLPFLTQMKIDSEPQEYQLCEYFLSLMWRDEMVQRKTLTGCVKLFKDMSLQSIKTAIYQDLILNHVQYKNNSHMIIRVSNPISINFIDNTARYQCSLGTRRIEGILMMQNKIDVPKGHSYLPNKNLGAEVKNLSISNKHGTITWDSSINIIDLNIQKNLKLVQQEIVCGQILGVPALVEFNSIPKSISDFSDQVITRKMQKCTSKMENCRMINYNPINKHWFVRLNYLKNATN